MYDVEGYVYLPFLEETRHMPKHNYSFGAEIHGQNERAAKHVGIQGQFCAMIELQPRPRTCIGTCAGDREGTQPGCELWQGSALGTSYCLPGALRSPGFG